MDIFNCEYQNHNFNIQEGYEELFSTLAADLKEEFWKIEDYLDNICCLEKMKLYESIFGDRSKFGKNLNNLNAERAELIKIISNQIGSENPYNLNFQNNKKKLVIDYLCLTSIANVIQKILRSIVNPNDFIHSIEEVIDKQNFCSIMNSEIWGYPLMQIKNELNQVTELTFKLSGNNDDEFEINYMLLFYYFYKALFPNVTSITIDFNLIQINKKYSELKNPTDFKDTKIKEISKNFDNLFLAYFLLTCIISLSNDSLEKLKIKSPESYISENNHIIGKEYANKAYKEKIPKEKGFILIKKLMKIKTIKQLSFSINSLDKYLFKEILNFIALHREIEKLELNLFYKKTVFNKRKIFFNYFRGQEYFEIDPNLIDKFGIIYYPYINKFGDDIMNVLDEDKILDSIYPIFKKNLNHLKILLNQYIISLKEFHLDISPYDELSKFESYNVEIILFILVILFSFEKSQIIESIKLKCSNIEYLYVSHIMKKINNLITPKLIDLSKCENLKNISIEMQGISLLFDFGLLPFDSLEKLELSISCLKDMEKISAFFKNHKHDFINLKQLNLSLPLVYDINFTFKEFMKILENLPFCLQELHITNENLMKKEEVLEIIQKIQKNKNSFNYELVCSCLELEEFFGKQMEDLKNFFNSKGNINLSKFVLIDDEIRRINLEFILPPDEGLKKSIIFSVNKILNNSEETNNEKNKKIFLNIFKFLGKRQNFNIILN